MSQTANVDRTKLPAHGCRLTRQQFEGSVTTQPLILEEGLVRSGRCAQGFRVGWIREVTRDTFAVKWLHGSVEEYPRELAGEEEE